MSAWQLNFSERFDYSVYGDILFPLVLSSDLSNRVLVRAKLDTGSDLCVFQKQYLELLGLEAERGTSLRIRTATGSFTANGHEVTITVGQLEWQAIVYFAEDENFPVSVVGPRGFLHRVRAGLVDYEQVLYLGPYEQP